jgi:hypothetical protein
MSLIPLTRHLLARFSAKHFAIANKRTVSKSKPTLHLRAKHLFSTAVLCVSYRTIDQGGRVCGSKSIVNIHNRNATRTAV